MTTPGQMTLQQALELALQHHQSGRLNEAEGLYRQILTVQPNQPDVLYLLGVLAHQVGRAEVAVELFRHAISIVPSNPSWHLSLGQALVGSGKLPEAIDAFGRATALNPELAEAHNNLGSALTQSRRLDDAIVAYRRAVAVKPNYFEALFNLGNLLRVRGDTTGAGEALHAALEAGPTNPLLCNDLGNALRELALLDDAARAYRLAMWMRPDLPESHNGLGSIYWQTGSLDEAIEEFNEAVRLRPTFAEARNNLATALLEKGDIDQAETVYREAISAKPDNAMAHHNLGLVLLLKGDFENGFEEYEWRRQAADLGKLVMDLPQPMWDGTSDLSGQRILIHAEQGFGDTIQFVRFIPQIKARGATIMLAVQRELGPLLSQVPDVAELILRGDPLPAFDLHSPILSIPRVLRLTKQTIPSPVPYLSADAALAGKWAERIGNEQRKKIGIAWAGHAGHIHDRRRSIPPEQLQPLASLGDVACFYSLQKDAPDPKPTMELIDWTGDLSDFADTAALIENLDLVITVDTAVAHLAGAMGKPVWLLLQHIPDWRWMLDRSDSPWYPTMKLYRQPGPGDWQTPLQQVVEDLHK